MSLQFPSFLVHFDPRFLSLQLLCCNRCLLLQRLSLPPKTSLLKLEDPVCANGGKWTLTFSRGKYDYSWLCTLQALIGEQFDHGDEICGAVVNVRNRQKKIALWTKNAANEAAQVSIGKQWKGILESNETIGFIFHGKFPNYPSAFTTLTRRLAA